MTVHQLKDRKSSDKIKGLLVDDNYDFYVVTEALVSNEIDLDYAPDAFSAHKMVKASQFDVIICDVHMPLMDGLTLLGEFQKKNINIPFVFVTGNASEKIVKQAFRLGAYNFLEKPFKKEALLEKVRDAIELCDGKRLDNEATTEKEEQDKAYIYNTLKSHYYDIDRILQTINQVNMPTEAVHRELEKKMTTGKCLFDDIQNLKASWKPAS